MIFRLRFPVAQIILLVLCMLVLSRPLIVVIWWRVTSIRQSRSSEGCPPPFPWFHSFVVTIQSPLNTPIASWSHFITFLLLQSLLERGVSPNWTRHLTFSLLRQS